MCPTLRWSPRRQRCPKRPSCPWILSLQPSQWLRSFHSFPSIRWTLSLHSRQCFHSLPWLLMCLSFRLRPLLPSFPSLLNSRYCQTRPWLR